jgi:hypothetical protein
VNIACHVKQPSKGTSFGGMLSWRWRGRKSSVRVVLTATTRILHRRFPRACEMVGQVFKFVQRLRWKLKVVCYYPHSFPFGHDFVPYLLTFPSYLRTNEYQVSFPGVKWPGCGSDCPPLPSIEVKKRVELFFYSPLGLHGLFWDKLYLLFQNT